MYRLLIITFLVIPLAAQAGEATFTVAEKRQVFQALGCAVNPSKGHGAYGSGDAKRLFDELKVRAIRLWGSSASSIASFKGQHDIAKQHGVNIFLMAPGGYNGNPEGWGGKIAGAVAGLRSRGIEMSATGVQNEPGNTRQRWIPAEEGARLMIATRKALNAKGLEDVTLLGPEFFGNNPDAKEWTRKVGENPEAVAAYDAVGTHSYNSGADEEMWQLVKEQDKEWWQTEAGEIGHLLGLPRDAFNGAEHAARFLGDINEGVTHFFWFLCKGGHQHYITSGKVYNYLKPISNAFLPGTQMYHMTSDIPGHKHAYWGDHNPPRERPPVIVASGVREDGKWALGAVNLTQSKNQETRKGTFWDAETFETTIVVPALQSEASLTFDVCKHGGDGTGCGETATMQNGRLTITLPEGKVVGMVAREATGMPTDTTGGTSGDAAATGGSGATATGATAGTTGTGLCNLITSTNAQAVPQGFAAPYNVLSATQELLVSVTCPSTSSGQATLSVGSGNNLQYVYNLAYTWRQNQWQQIPLSGLNLQGGAWYVGRAQGTLPQTGAELNRNNFVVAYVCTWTGTEWKCGCRDQACTQGLWQLQVFRSQ